MARTDSIERSCIVETCGRTFKGTNAKCSKCRSKPRNCVECQKPFRGCTRKCSTCIQTKRTCTECGAEFKGHTTRCSPCRRAERAGRPCRTCKVPHTGFNLDCSRCLATKKNCDGCGQRIRSHKNLCWNCSRTNQTCPKCDATHFSAHRLCRPCRTASVPVEVRRAAWVALSNTRRARKRAAEVDGPVPHEVYQAIRAEPECVYCGGPNETVDHVRALHRQGWEHESNLVPACEHCNYSKNNKLLTEWDQDKVLRAVAISEKVAAEYFRLDPDALQSLQQGLVEPQ